MDRLCHLEEGDALVEDIRHGAWLKRRRRQLDLTQKALAYKAGCSMGTIRKIESDERRPSRQLAGLLAAHLEIPSGQAEAFIAFARTEPYASEVTFPSIPAPAGETLPIPETTHQSLPPSPAGRPPKHNLPSETTPFLGREREIAALDELLAHPDGRLVTIVGPGGIGKTRLALAYAEQMIASPPPVPRPGYPDGAYFVDLAPLREADQIVLTLAETLDFRLKGGDQERRSPKRQLLDHLLDRNLLLVMDNLEHLLTASEVAGADDGMDGAGLVAEIVQSTHAVSILVTSRERLNLRMEQVFAIDGLAYPDLETATRERLLTDAADYTAVQLFLQAAQRIQAAFTLQSGEELLSLARICRLVGGMPLALELAASWVDTLTLEEIATELQQGLDILETELRDVPERQRSVRASFDYTWRLLDEAEQAVFTQLSIFRGGFTRAAAQEVTGASLRQLSRLVNKSLIRLNKRRGRYQVHELLRQYGAERLGRDTELEGAVQDRHSTYYCHWLAEHTDDHKGAHQRQVVSAIEADIENVRLAWNTAIIRQDLNAIGISLESLYRFHMNNGWMPQGVNEIEKAVTALRTGAAVGERGIVLGRLLAVLGWLFNLFNPIGGAREILTESLHLLRRLGARRHTLMPLLGLAENQRSLQGSNQLLQEGLDLAREIGDQWAIGHALSALGHNFRQMGDYDRAEQRYREGLKQFEQITGDKGGIAVTLTGMSDLAIDQGRYVDALDLAQKTMSVSKEFHPNFPIQGLKSLSKANYALGKHAEAKELVDQFLKGVRELDMRTEIAPMLFQLGKIAFCTGAYALACRHHQESLAVALELDQLEMVARNHDALGRVNIAQGAGTRAREHLQAALHTAIPMGRPPVLLDCLASIAELLAEEEDLERAALPAVLIGAHPASRAKAKERAARLLTRLEAELMPDDLVAVRLRSQQSDLDTVAAQLLADLEMQ